MWPIGTYKHFLRKIKGQEEIEKKVEYFGVLFCDVRQAKAKEYILNYLDVFHNCSGKFIDFYIPGYIPKSDYVWENSDGVISINKKKFLFNFDIYKEFCTSFEHDFGVKFPFSARLVILEYKKGNFSRARKIVINLEDSEEGIKSAGELFLKIFNCAEDGEMEQTLSSLSNYLSKNDKRGMIGASTKTVLNFFSIDIDPIINQYQKVSKFKIND